MGSVFSGIFGGKKPEPTNPQPAPQVDQEAAAPADKKKNLVRALLLGTATPEGDLSPVTTGRRKLLGN